jgi:hypothetical protein
VTSQGAKHHDGRAPFAWLKADFGPVEVESQRVVESENLLFWIVFHDPHFVLKQLLDAVLGDEDVAHRDPQLVCGIGA